MINYAIPNMILIDRETDSIIKIQKIKIRKPKPCMLKFVNVTLVTHNTIFKVLQK